MLKSLFGLFSVVVSGYVASTQELFPMFLTVLGPGLLAGLFLSTMLLAYQWRDHVVAFMAGFLYLLMLSFGMGYTFQQDFNPFEGISYSLGIMISLGSGLLLFPQLLANFRQPEESEK